MHPKMKATDTPRNKTFVEKPPQKKNLVLSKINDLELPSIYKSLIYLH